MTATERVWIEEGPVLYGRYNLGHRMLPDGNPACPYRGRAKVISEKQAQVYGVLVCPDCWKGERPW